MEYPFDALHAGIESQILNLPAGIPDSEAVTQAKALPDSIEKFLALGKAFSRQLRYREAIDAYTEGLKLEPENLPLLRLRAGRYLTTLQSNLAITDFEKACPWERKDWTASIGSVWHITMPDGMHRRWRLLRTVCLYAMTKWGSRFFTGTR